MFGRLVVSHLPMKDEALALDGWSAPGGSFRRSSSLLPEAPAPCWASNVTSPPERHCPCFLRKPGAVRTFWGPVAFPSPPSGIPHNPLLTALKSGAIPCSAQVAGHANAAVGFAFVPDSARTLRKHPFGES